MQSVCEVPQVRPRQTVVAIVAFHPNIDRLSELVRIVSKDALALAIYRNSPMPEEAEAELRAASGGTALQILGTGKNLGLGTAYNFLLDWAHECEARHLLLFDQDSTPAKNMIVDLEEAAQRLSASGVNSAIVGPQPVTERGALFKTRMREQPLPIGSLVPVDFLISSGALVRVDAAAQVGPFREDYFIDAIDIEWCLRAWHLGWSVWLARDTEMVHRLGRGVIYLPFGVELTDQPPCRLYTYLRNQLAMVRMRHVPWDRKLRTLIGLLAKCAVYLVRNRFSRAVVLAVGAGLWDGLRNRLGPPDRVWESKKH